MGMVSMVVAAVVKESSMAEDGETMTQIANGALQLESPLLAAVSQNGMKVCRVLGLVDHEGATSFMSSRRSLYEGEQGDRVIYHYPRPQNLHGEAETTEPLTAPLERIRLAGAFRALPVTDPTRERGCCVFSAICRSEQERM